jgi:transcriptional regulator with XRE-family HTH domain
MKRRRRFATIQDYMLATGLRQVDLARLAKTTQATISRLLNATLIRLEVAKRLAKIGNVRIESFAREYYRRQFERKPQWVMKRKRRRR